MAATISLDAFLHGIRSASVVDPGQLDAYLLRLGSADVLPRSAEELAGHLVRDGYLTQFQSQQFLTDRWGGLTLGKYQVLERLGRGANGSVFLCKHPAMNRTVAIKVLPPADRGGASAQLRFEREARAGASVDHPNIIKVFDFDQEGDIAYLVMEYIAGINLYELPLRIGPLSVERAAHYVRQAALGLQAIQLAGLVHRDIKPANMLLDATGTVKILDLGLARFSNDEEDQLTMQHDASRVLGTADYLSPEQALNSHAVDIRADIYSLGGTLYYLLAGKPPYGDGATVQKLVWAQTRPPIPITNLRPDLPADLVAVVDRLLAKNVADRYQTPAEVVDALAPWARTPIPKPAPEEVARDKEHLSGLSLRDLTSSGRSSAGTSRPASSLPEANPGASTAAAAAGRTDIPPLPSPKVAAPSRPRPTQVRKQPPAARPPTPVRRPPGVAKSPVSGPPQPETVVSMALPPGRSGINLLGRPAAQATVIVPRVVVSPAPPASPPRPPAAPPVAPSRLMRQPVPAPVRWVKKPAPAGKKPPIRPAAPPPTARWRTLLAHPKWVPLGLASATTALIVVAVVCRYLGK